MIYRDNLKLLLKRYIIKSIRFQVHIEHTIHGINIYGQDFVK